MLFCVADRSATVAFVRAGPGGSLVSSREAVAPTQRAGNCLCWHHRRTDLDGGSADDRFHDRQTEFRHAPVAPRAPVKGDRMRTRFSYRPKSRHLRERA
jgi:hypothetical protein